MLDNRRASFSDIELELSWGMDKAYIILLTKGSVKLSVSSHFILACQNAVAFCFNI